MLSYDRCLDIVNNYPNDFYMKEYIIDGFKICIFNYRRDISYSLFKELDSFDIRGMTFIEENGIIVKQYLSLPKFFNINQTENDLLEDLEKLEIDKAYEKIDGTLIQFIKLPNGKVIAKSKMGFDNIYTDRAMEIYNIDRNLQKIVKDSFINEEYLFFEYVSSDLKVVVDYESPKLYLINVRDKYGKFTTIDNYNYNKPEILNYKCLNDLINLTKSLTNHEGFIIHFTNGHISKLKTKWYIDKHYDFTINYKKANFIINAYITNTIDDILPILNKDEKNYVLDICEKVKKKYDKIVYHCQKYIDIYITEYKSDKKSFYIFLDKNKILYKDIIMYVVNNGDLYSFLNAKIIKETFRLKQANLWLSKKI